MDAPASRLHLVNTVLACRRYYLDGASKSEIAAELGISRFKVARLLERARREGIVRIDRRVSLTKGGEDRCGGNQDTRGSAEKRKEGLHGRRVNGWVCKSGEPWAGAHAHL